jgi:YidC/Oxa1 family membrane protein insertase
MADSQGTPGSPGTGGRKELSMEIRLLIAFLLMGAVLFVTPYFYKNSSPPAPKPAATTSAVPARPPEPAPSAPAPAPTAEPAAPVASAGTEQTFTINTSLYQIRFSNRGGVVQSWTLKQFRDRAGRPLQLVNFAAATKVGYPFAWAFRQQPPVDPNKALFVMRPDEDGLGVGFEYSDGHAVFRKSFHFSRDSYLSQITSEALIDGAPAPHLLAWRGGFGDQSNFAAAATQRTLYYDLNATSTFHPNGTLETKTAKDAKKGTVTDRGDYSFAGIQDTYFTAVFLGRQGGATEIDTYSDNVANAPGGKEEPFVGMAVGDSGPNRFLLYVGPKDTDILEAVDPRLKTVIDWGWFGLIAKPLFYALRWTDRNVAHNYGWSIVLVTVVINLLLLPLRFSSLKSARKMQSLAPQIKAINDKYKNISLRDPRKAEQNQEVMDLYKKHGVNPVGGCLPMLPQIPILYAFYTVLRVAIEMRGAHWLWVTDLSQPEQLPIHVLPLTLIVTQFLVQKMTPNPTPDPSQAKMMMFMPLIFGFMFYNFQAGLVLYWLTGNLVGIVQQWAMNRLGPAPPPPVEVAKPAAKRKGK